MNWTKGAFLAGSLVLTLFLVTAVQDWSRRAQQLQEIRLEEQLSMAAADAIRDSFDVADPEPRLYPETVWERFLAAAEAGGLDAARFTAAVFTTPTGSYRYTGQSGWSDRQDGTAAEEYRLTVLYEDGKVLSGGRERVLVGSARCKKRAYYLVQWNGEGDGYYHRQDCPELEEEGVTENRQMELYYSMEECAGRGASPCPVCIP